MEYKYLSWLCVCLCILLNIFGFYWLFVLIVSLFCFTLGVLSVVYLQHSDETKFLECQTIHASGRHHDPLEPIKSLGLNLAFDEKPVILLSPDIRVQTESKKHKQSIALHPDTRKKSLIDSGIELLFKKNPKTVKDGGICASSTSHSANSDSKSFIETTTVPGGTSSPSHHEKNSSHSDEHHKWKLFDSIKIHTDKRQAADTNVDVHFAEECGASQPIAESMPIYKLHTDSAILDQHGSPKKKLRAMLSGNKQIDQLLHTFINYILRDFIDSWFFSLSDNKEFSEFRTRNCIEESVQNICTRMKNTQWIPLMTTRLVDIAAMHARLYRLANDTVNLQLDETKSTSGSSNQNGHQTQKSNGNDRNTSSPQRRLTATTKLQQHRRNKSETDLSWYLGNQRTVGNSKFYDSVDSNKKSKDKAPLIGDATEAKLVTAFFNQCEMYRDECLDEEVLERYLTHCMETVLYFTLPEEDFACIPLRSFLSTLLANVVCKPIIDMLSEPDFINLQVAKSLTKEPPSSEIFLRLLRQCDDLDELRAVRQLITKEMDSKYKDPNAAAELNSLKYTQKLIDLRISFLQNNKIECERDCKPASLPILSLDELLNKELTLSYYLDYLSMLNLQRYVIFYLTAREWKATVTRYVTELLVNKPKAAREDAMKMLREKATNVYKEYLAPSSMNALNIDSGLIETLNIRLNDATISPDPSWFESICKYVYEKIKNEDIFLHNFYQSSAYRKLLLELEFYSSLNVDSVDIECSGSSAAHLQQLQQMDTGSDSNSGDLVFDDDIDFVALDGLDPLSSFVSTNNQKISPKHHSPSHHHPSGNDQPIEYHSRSEKNIENFSVDLDTIPTAVVVQTAAAQPSLLDVIGAGVSKHYRSHSDCTGLVQNMNDIHIEPLSKTIDLQQSTVSVDEAPKIEFVGDSLRVTCPNPSSDMENVTLVCPQHRLSAKIINTAINCEGQFAVYAIQVTVVEDNQQKSMSWHVYRRYSRFLDLKKALVKRYPSIAQIPFPAKKAFQNTQRSVLEHRMTVLNEFLKTISMRADDNDELHAILRDFLEPDTNDKKIHGGAVIRTIETIVNPLKSGMRTIKNMPDTLVGGMAKILLGKGPTKESPFLDVTPIHLEHSSEYPALTSALNLLDEVFDLQARSQWLRRGLINRLLGAPWVSQTANKRITQAAKTVIEVEKIEHILGVILNTIWPDGKRSNNPIPREESTKQRTRMAAKVALFALLSDDLKHVVGSETTRFGLLNCFSMWQHKTLNMRLVLVLFNEILTTLYQTDDLAKHTK